MKRRILLIVGILSLCLTACSNNDENKYNKFYSETVKSEESENPNFEIPLENEIEEVSSEIIEENSETNEILEEFDLTIYFIDVGQGDSIYLESKGQNMLVDTGTSSSQENILNFLEEQNINSIDYLVATHNHEDHIGNSDEVLDDYVVKNILLSRTPASSKAYQTFMLAVENEKANIVYPEKNHSFNFGSTKITVLSAKETEDLNDSSIVLLVENGESSILLMGDSSKSVEKQILSEYADLIDNIDILKVGHHGSSSSSDEDFILKTDPYYSIISCAKENSYGHPHTSTMDLLNSIETNVYSTYLGTVEFYSDGYSIIKR